jgi:hypothetical protein
MSSDNEIQNRLILMAQNLLKATREGKISWRLTDVEYKFIYAGTRSSVTIEVSQDNFSNETLLCLLNERGTVVDSLETGSSLGDDNSQTAFRWNDLLEDLYQAARRVAHNVDEALESMILDIERGTPSPAPLPPKKKSAARNEDPWASETPYSDEPPF